MNRNLPEIGDVVIVHGMWQKSKVVSVHWDTTFFDWIIELDWNEYGTSKVKLHDENKVWYRFKNVN